MWKFLNKWVLCFAIFAIWFQVSPLPFVVDIIILTQIFPELRQGNVDGVLLFMRQVMRR